ncbi:MAG TPA: allantoicase [Gemmatimonadaceae bacterium]|nr:allantoicase [Gemmatimonadaceae bacterium]
MMQQSDFTDLVDLAAERLGGSVLIANDEFFAPKEALLKASPPEWREGVFTERGKWMDGWETRRRRAPGHDWCILRLGIPGVVNGFVVDTSFFRGNFPESCAADGAEIEGPSLPDPDTFADDDAVEWTSLLPRSPLAGDARNAFAVTAARRVTHIRFSIFPDGGVARLRVFGEARPGPGVLRAGRELDLASIENGGYVVLCSDMFFGHRQNLIMPGRSTHMGDGWETKRRRGPGHDWTIVRLGARGALQRIDLDTDHFKGNAPGSCMLEWCDSPLARPEELAASVAWRELVPNSALQPHTRHSWTVKSDGAATHLRLNIYPDGGVARLRAFGMLRDSA